MFSNSSPSLISDVPDLPPMQNVQSSHGSAENSFRKWIKRNMYAMMNSRLGPCSRGTLVVCRSVHIVEITFGRHGQARRMFGTSGKHLVALLASDKLWTHVTFGSERMKGLVRNRRLRNRPLRKRRSSTETENLMLHLNSHGMMVTWRRAIKVGGPMEKPGGTKG